MMTFLYGKQLEQKEKGIAGRPTVAGKVTR